MYKKSKEHLKDHCIGGKDIETQQLCPIKKGSTNCAWLIKVSACNNSALSDHTN